MAVMHRILVILISKQRVLGILHKCAQKITAGNGADKKIAGQQQ